MNIAKRGFLLLLVATAVVYVYGLGRVPFVGADEPRYAEVGREMFVRGDAVTPTLNSRTWFEKPALAYWSEMASFKLFGVSEWSARLGSALAGWFTVLIIGWACGRVERSARDDAGLNDETKNRSDTRANDDALSSEGSHVSDDVSGLRLACAAVAATSAGLIVFSRAVNFDIFLTATVTLSLACFFVAGLETDAARRRLLLAGFYAGAGCAMLAKGLVGIVITFGVAALYKILRRDLARAWKSLLWGVPLTLCVAASWYVPVTLAHGRAFLNEFFIQHHFARFVSNRFHHPEPFYFYLLVLPIAALPWTLFLFTALKRLWHDARRTRFNFGDGAHERLSNDARDGSQGDATLRLRLFALVWIVVPLAFFSVAQSKLPGYILPALPAACLLAGDELRRFARGFGGGWLMRATGCLLVAAAVAAIVYAVNTRLVTTGCAVAVAAPLALAGLFALFAKGARVRTACAVVVATLLAVMLIAGCAQEGIARRESVRDLLRLAAARGYASAPVVELYGVERSAQFYAAGRLEADERGEPRVHDGINQIEQLADERRATVLVIVPVEDASQLTNLGQARAELIGDNGVHALVAVRASE